MYPNRDLVNLRIPLGEAISCTKQTKPSYGSKAELKIVKFYSWVADHCSNSDIKTWYSGLAMLGILHLS